MLNRKLKITSLVFCLILILIIAGFAEVKLITNMPGVTRYIGLSTDTKPTNCESGSEFFETDTKYGYIYDSSTWQLIRKDVNIASDASGTKDVNIASIASDIPVKQEFFDVSIYPVAELLTTTGVQYETIVTNGTTSYVDLFDFDTDTYFPDLDGTLAWVYVNISFEVKGGTNLPVVTYKIEAKNGDLASWTIMSAEETYTTTTSYVGKRLEGYLLITTDAIDDAPFDIRLQFKSDATDGTTETIYTRLKNDTVIRLVGSRE